MSESRNMHLALLLSLLLHAVLLGLVAGGGTEQTIALGLSDNQDVAARLDGDAGAISVLLIGDSEVSAVSLDASFADIAEPLSKLKSPNDPSDSDDGRDAGERATQGAVAEDSESTSPTGAAKAGHHAIPLDDYSAQIMGRIERTWVRPLAHLDGTFHCEVHISQTPQGEVRDIALTQCNGDPAWRESITRAIRYAAPLPAAPNEKAFRPVLTLTFQAPPLSQALLAELLSVAEELSSVEQRDDTLKPAGDRVRTPTLTTHTAPTRRHNVTRSSQR